MEKKIYGKSGWYRPVDGSHFAHLVINGRTYCGRKMPIGVNGVVFIDDIEILSFPENKICECCASKP